MNITSRNIDKIVGIGEGIMIDTPVTRANLHVFARRDGTEASVIILSLGKSDVRISYYHDNINFEKAKEIKVGDRLAVVFRGFEGNAYERQAIDEAKTVIVIELTGARIVDVKKMKRGTYVVVGSPYLMKRRGKEFAAITLQRDRKVVTVKYTSDDTINFDILGRMRIGDIVRYSTARKRIISVNK